MPTANTAAPPMMVLGPVTFAVSGAAYEQLDRTTRYTWASQTVLGSRSMGAALTGGPALQFIGSGDDTISLKGTMFPEFGGGPLELSAIRIAAALGAPLPLLDGAGRVFGLWVVEEVTETNSVFLADGTARKIEFTVSLRKYLGALR